MNRERKALLLTSKATRFVLILCMSLSVACSGSRTGAAQSTTISIQQPAQLVLLNGGVYTVNPEQPWAEALAVDQQRIVYVGSNQGVQQFIGADTEIIDLHNKLLLPGFQDAHIHPLEGASLASFMSCDLSDIAAENPDPETWVDKIRPCADEPMPHDWVLGGGHHNTHLLRLQRPPKDLLDEAFPNKPAAFMEKSSHSMWVNSKALEVLGIDRDTPNPQGGVIFRDPDSGEPNGVLSDSAGDELMHVALSRNPKLQAARYEALLVSQDLLVQHGITSANNARVYWDRGNFDPWLRAADENRLKSRMVLSLWAYPHMDDELQLRQLEAMYSNDTNSMLRVSQVKFYSDGVPSLNSAAVLDPYGYLIFPGAKAMGLNYFTEQRLAKYIARLERKGFTAIIHTLGDRAVRESLNAIAYAKKRNPELAADQRHYLSHVSWVHASDIPRFTELNVSVDTQINYVPEGVDFSELDADYDGNAEVDRFDEQTIWEALLANTRSDLDALPELVQSGARLILSSDWDVGSIDPLFSIQQAFDVFTDIRDDDEILKLAIKAYTLNPAYALRQEDRTGSLQVGKLADLVVLDQNLFEINKTNVKDTRVLMTFVGGKRVY